MTDAVEMEHVLLVEDSPTAAKMLMRMLRGPDGSGPFRAMHAESLEEAGVAVFTHGPFDAIVLDLTLPDSSGIETYHTVRQSAPDTAVLILSGTENDELAREAVDLGAQDYVVKTGLNQASLVRSVRWGIVRHAARKDLERALVEADEANRRLQDFVSLASHELLSPLTVIDGFARMLDQLWDETPDDKRREQVRQIAKSSRSLSRTAKHFLQNARADASELSPRRDDFNAHDLAKSLVDEIADEVQLDVNGHAPADYVVTADRIQVETILSNLIRNAQAYGAAPITVELHRGEHLVEVAVRDAGPGVPDDFVGNLFERYARAESARDVPGSGLGLFVGRKMARANGGDLHHDTSQGAGARFVLTVPLADA